MGRCEISPYLIQSPQISLVRWSSLTLSCVRVASALAGTSPRPHVLTLELRTLTAFAAGDGAAPVCLAELLPPSASSIRVEMAKQSAMKRWRPKKEGCTDELALDGRGMNADGTRLELGGRQIALAVTLYEKRRRATSAGGSPFQTKPCGVRVVSAADGTEMASVTLDLAALAASISVAAGGGGKVMSLPLYRSTKGSSRLLAHLDVVVSCRARTAAEHAVDPSEASDAESFLNLNVHDYRNLHDSVRDDENEHVASLPATITEGDDEEEDEEAHASVDEMPPAQDGAALAAADAAAAALRAANEAVHEALTRADDTAHNAARAGVQALAVCVMYGPIAEAAAGGSPVDAAPFPHPTLREPLPSEHLAAALAHAAHNLTTATARLTPVNASLCERLVLRLCVAHCLDSMLVGGVDGAHAFTIDEGAVSTLLTRAFEVYANACRVRGDVGDTSKALNLALAPVMQLGALRQQLSVRGFTDEFARGYTALATRFGVRGDALAARVLHASLDAAPSANDQRAAKELLELVREKTAQAGEATPGDAPERIIPEGWVKELLEVLDGNSFRLATARMERGAVTSTRSSGSKALTEAQQAAAAKAKASFAGIERAVGGLFKK